MLMREPERRLAQKPFDLEPASTIGQDFRIFLEPGFWAALVSIGLLAGVTAGVLLYGNIEYGISHSDGRSDEDGSLRESER